MIDFIGSTRIDLRGLSQAGEQDIARFESELSMSELQLERVRRWLAEADNYYDELLDLTLDELIELNDRPAEIDADAEEMVAHTPANLDYWTKVEFWSPDEAAALSFDVEPVETDEADLEDDEEPTLFAQALSRRSLMLARAQETGRLAKLLRPRDAAAFLVERGVSLGPKFAEWAATASSDQSEALPQGQARSTLSRMVVGMAIMHYGFDPNDIDGSRAHALIASELKEVWDKMDPSTVKSCLSEAVDYMSLRKVAKIPRSAKRFAK